jgi:hypothetical protein
MIEILGWDAWFVTTPAQEIVRYSSDDTAFADLPKDGCLGFVIHERHDYDPTEKYRNIISGRDWYFLAKGVGDNDLYGGNMDLPGIRSDRDIEARYDAATVIRGIFTDATTMESVDKEMWEKFKV